MPGPPKALIFDLGGVIVPLHFKQAYSRMAALCHCEPDDIPRRIGKTDLVRRFETGQIEPEPFACELLDAVGAPPMPFYAFRDLWCWIFGEDTLLPESLFASLASRYKLVLLSNTNRLHFEVLTEKHPLLGHFHEKILSYEVGAMKPSPEIYQAAIARAACDPADCFFTDDVLPYIEGARAQGIDAVQFLSAAQLESELHSRGITW